MACHPNTPFTADVIGWMDERYQRRCSIPLCGSCGVATGSPLAQVCTRTDCGLSDRQHHTQRDAA